MHTLCSYFHPQGFHSPFLQLKAHHAVVSAADILSGCRLDMPVTRMLGRETDINILPLCCPYSSVEEHDVAGGRRREGGESGEEGWGVREGGACHPSVCAV